MYFLRLFQVAVINYKNMNQKYIGVHMTTYKPMSLDVFSKFSAGVGQTTSRRMVGWYGKVKSSLCWTN
jgi:hypothetical protein